MFTCQHHMHTGTSTIHISVGTRLIHIRKLVLQSIVRQRQVLGERKMKGQHKVAYARLTKHLDCKTANAF